MPAKIAKTHNLARALSAFKHSGVAWYPLVFVWIDVEEECDNPRCSQDADMKQVHLLNGEVVTIQVCFPCGQQLALDTGMVRQPEDFAILDGALSS